MSENRPASSMIRVPTPLIPLVKELTRLHRQGRTQAILDGVGELIAAIDSSNESSIVAIDSSTISELIARVERLESVLMQPDSIAPQKPAKRSTSTRAQSTGKRGDRPDPLDPPLREISDSTMRRWAGWAEMEPAAYVEFLELRGWIRRGKGSSADYLPPGE